MPQTILLVDDDEAFRYAATSFLERAGYAVIAVETTMKAFEACSPAPSFDLLVADIHMPPGQPHGISFARIVRHKYGLPTILVTAFAEFAAAEIDLPGPVLFKPIELSELLATVQSFLAPPPAS